jgi:hypothetical protein
MLSKAARLAARKDLREKHQSAKQKATDAQNALSHEEMIDLIAKLRLEHNQLEKDKPVKKTISSLIMVKNEPFKITKMKYTPEDQKCADSIAQKQQIISKQIRRLRDILDPSRVTARSRKTNNFPEFKLEIQMQ